MTKIEAIVIAMVLAYMLGAGFSSTAKADTWLSATITSYHSDDTTSKTSTGKHNSQNFGLGFEHDVDFVPHSRFVGGFYDNSFYKTSTYVGLSYMPWTVGPAKIGAMFGVVTGYDNNNVMPTILPTVSFEGKTFGANIGLMPSWSDRGTGIIIGLQLKMKIK